MIRIGLSEREKQREVAAYVQEHGIKKVYAFAPAQFPLTLKLDSVTLEQYGYDDIIMYKTFYPLLSKIDPDTLLVFSECLRTQKRSDLTYNCAHHYCNQTPHKIVFEHFPFIESKDDFMILLDLINKGKYKGKGFDYLHLQHEDIKAKPHRIKIIPVPVETTTDDLRRYEAKRESLFSSLGEKEPDTIPRALQLLAGDLKKRAVRPDKLYVARNHRLGLPNVVAYSDVTGRGEYAVIDTHWRRLNFLDFIKTTGMTRIEYLCTTLPIDNYILTDLTEWKARCDAFYAQASLYQ